MAPVLRHGRLAHRLRRCRLLKSRVECCAVARGRRRAAHCRRAVNGHSLMQHVTRIAQLSLLPNATPRRTRPSRGESDQPGQNRKQPKSDPEGRGGRDLTDDRRTADEARPSEGRHDSDGRTGMDAGHTAGGTEHHRDHERQSESEAAEPSEKDRCLVRHKTKPESDGGNAGKHRKKVLGPAPSKTTCFQTVARSPSPANRW